MATEEPQDNTSSLKSLLILEVMSSSLDYMGINEISRISGLSKSTVHRVLNEMAGIGYIEKKESIKKYSIGMKAVTLATRFMSSNSLILAAQEDLKELNRVTGETVHLISMVDYEIIFLDKIDTKHSLGVVSSIGKRNPAYCTSGGKAIMAFSDEEWLKNFFSAVELKRCTKNTQTNEARLRKELAAIRKRGYAVDNREYNEDIICIGAPVFLSRRRPSMAAVTVCAPSYRFSLEDAKKIAPLIITCTQNISRKIGNV